MISRGAEIALGASFCFASAIIFQVHEMQTADRKRLREGERRNLEELEQRDKFSVISSLRELHRTLWGP